MYVTRPLSMYRRSPEALYLPPPEGPNSGYLVLHDQESYKTTCCGMCEDTSVKDLPFPQNKDLTVEYGSNKSKSYDDVAFIPVLNQPLSSNTYHVIKRAGRRRGEVFTNSREEDMGSACCCTYVRDVKPKPLDTSDIYQQIEIIPRKHGYFTAKAVAEDGFPPHFLRRKGWTVTMHTPSHYQLGEAPGLNSALRARLPGFDFSIQNESSEAVVVGKWYCPFMFIKEGGLKLKDQMKRFMFYEMRLEQRWEKIFGCDHNVNDVGNVFVDAIVQKEVVFVAGNEAVWDDRNVGDGFMWFKSFGGEKSVGLSVKIVERMKWEQERVGWVCGDERQVRMERVEEFKGTGTTKAGWKKFAAYVLVERFLLKRMGESSAVLTYDFKHTHQIRSKWE